MSIVPGQLPIVQDNIDRCGQHLFAVFRDEVEPGFLYTIGNACRGLPELLVIGDFPPHSIAPILNQVGRTMRETGQIPQGDIDLGGLFPIRARLAGEQARQRFTLQARYYLRHDAYAVVQLLIPDLFGRYPGEAGCDPRYDVPLV